MRVAPLLLVLLCASPALAQLRDSKGLAQDHIDRGLRYYNTQQYDLAIDEWKQAYVLDSNPETLFGIGQAQRMKGDCKAAAETYRSVLRDPLPEKQAAEVRKVLKTCEDALKKGERQREREPGDVRGAQREPAPEPTPPPESRPGQGTGPDALRASPGPWYTDWIGDTLAGLAIVSLAGGGTFWYLAGQAEDDAKMELQFDAFVDKAEEAERNRKIAVGGFIGGGVLGLAAIVRYATRDTGGGEDEAEVGATPTRGGAIFTVGGRF